MKMQFSDVEVEQRCGEGGMSSFLCLKGGRLVKCMLTLQWSLFHKKQFYQCCWVISNSQVVIKSRRGFNCRKDGIAWKKKLFIVSTRLELEATIASCCHCYTSFRSLRPPTYPLPVLLSFNAFFAPCSSVSTPRPQAKFAHSLASNCSPWLVSMHYTLLKNASKI